MGPTGVATISNNAGLLTMRRYTLAAVGDESSTTCQAAVTTTTAKPVTTMPVTTMPVTTMKPVTTMNPVTTMKPVTQPPPTNVVKQGFRLLWRKVKTLKKTKNFSDCEKKCIQTPACGYWNFRKVKKNKICTMYN